jgi:hypothetical protein
MTEYLFVHYLIQGIQLPSKEMLPSETERDTKHGLK